MERRKRSAALILAVAVLIGGGCATDRNDPEQAVAPSSNPIDSNGLATTNSGPDVDGKTDGDATNDAGPESGVQPDVDPATTTTAADQGGPSEVAEDQPAIVLRQGGINTEFAEALQSVAGVDWVGLVAVGQVHLIASTASSGETVDAPPPGYMIQLEAVAHPSLESVDRHAPELAESLAALGDREVLLSASSAGIRRLDVGSTVTFHHPDGDAAFEVAAILPDSVVGTAEVVFAGTESMLAAGAGGGVRRSAFVGYSGSGPELEQELLDLNGGTGIRVFGGRDNEGGDRRRTTLAAIEVKKIFGEFAFRPRGSSAIEIDPTWTQANLVVADLPLLGQARCHRVFAEILTEVLQSLVDDGLGDVIDSSTFQGCWNPRRISGSSRLSKHAWGMAADINFGNPLDGGPGSPVHPELLERMLAADVISGHLWTATPDPGHFEYRGPNLDR